MANLTLTLLQYEAAYKPFTIADHVTIHDTGYSFADLTAAQFATLAMHNVDAINATDDVLPLSTSQYEALGSVALTASDTVVLRDWGSILATGTIAEIAGLAAKGVDLIQSFSGKFTFSKAQYDAMGNVQVAAGTTMQVRGTAVGDRISGRASDEILKGLKGNDRLSGEAGNDWLVGGLGKDLLTGGAGEDAFVFDTKPNRKANLDKISDFNAKYDSIYLDNAVFNKLGKGSEASPRKLKKAFFTIGEEANDKYDYVIYNKKKGIIYYDSDGSGAAAQVEIATVKKGVKITYQDFFVI